MLYKTLMVHLDLIISNLKLLSQMQTGVKYVVCINNIYTELI